MAMGVNVVKLLLLVAFFCHNSRAEEPATAAPNRWLHNVRSKRILDNIAAFYADLDIRRGHHVAFHSKETVAVVYFQGPVTDYRHETVADRADGCQLMKVKDEDYKNEVVAQLHKFMAVQSLPAGLMVRLIYQCQHTGRPRRSTIDHYMMRNGQILSQIAANYSSAESPDSFRASHVAFYAEETVVVLHTDRRGRMDDCHLMSIAGEDRVKEVLSNLTQYLPVNRFPVEALDRLINRCQQVGRSSVVREPPMKELSKLFTNIIVPGTKWCGKGDVAESYEDLGPSSETDKCCRAHDHCPLSIEAMRSNHKLFNFSLKTKLLCVCEEELRKCLARQNSTVSKYVAHLYFHFFQSSQCITEDSSSGTEKFGFSNTTADFKTLLN